MNDDFWTGKLDWTGTNSFDGFGDGMASGKPGGNLNAGYGRGIADGKEDVEGFNNFF